MKYKTIIKYIATIILVGLLLLIGYDFQKQPKIPSPPAGQKEEIEKWNLYVDLSNNLETDFAPALQNYFQIFGYGPEYLPTGQPEYMADFLSTLVTNKELAREIDQALAKAANSDNDLDQATYEMSLHLKQLWSNLVKARDYHTSGQWPESDSAAVKELHSNIFTAYQGLEASKSRFRNILVKEDAERRKRDIQSLADQGLVVQPALLKLVDSGQALQDIISGQNITSSSLTSLDLTEFSRLYEIFSQNVIEYDKLLSEVPSEILEGFKLTDLEAISQQAWIILASGKVMMEPKAGSGALGLATPEETTGTPEHFSRKMSELVDLYNSINQ